MFIGGCCLLALGDLIPFHIRRCKVIILNENPSSFSEAAEKLPELREGEKPLSKPTEGEKRPMPESKLQKGGKPPPQKGGKPPQPKEGKPLTPITNGGKQTPRPLPMPEKLLTKVKQLSDMLSLVEDEIISNLFSSILLFMIFLRSTDLL